MHSRTGNVLDGIVQREAVLGQGGAAGGGGVCAEIVLGQRNGDGAIGREVELGIPFSPISAKRERVRVSMRLFVSYYYCC